MATRERLSESIPVLNEQSDIGVTTSVVYTSFSWIEGER